MKQRRGPNKNLTQALKNLNKDNPRAKTLLPVYGELRNNVETLFDSCKKYLHGEYNLYTIYKDLEKNPVINYGLVYADFYEKDFINEDEFLNTYQKDAILLHKKLIQSKLPLDYYYIMPYYIKLDGNSILYNGNIILTNELKIE